MNIKPSTTYWIGILIAIIVTASIGSYLCWKYVLHNINTDAVIIRHNINNKHNGQLQNLNIDGSPKTLQGAKITESFSPKLDSNTKDLMKKNPPGRLIVTPEDVTDDKLIEIVKEINTTMPLMVSKDARIENVQSGHNLFQYNITLVHYKASQIPIHFIEAMSVQMHQIICHDAGMLSLLTNGITIIYEYNSNDKLKLGDVQITKESCNAML